MTTSKQALQPYPAELHTAARRLRWLRRDPNHAYGVRSNEDYNTGMAHGYEYALRVLLDEFHIKSDRDSWYLLMYGPQGEDPDIQPPE